MQFAQMTSQLTCPRCDEALSITPYSYDNHAYCERCYKFRGVIRIKELCCSQPKLEFAKHIIKDGRFQLRKYCTNCCTTLGGSYSQKGIDMTKLPCPDNPKKKQINLIRESEWEEFSKKCDAIFTEKEKLRPEALYFRDSYQEYEDYIRSKEWSNRRKKVLERDKNICQSCLSKTATEVHHITYKHFKNEPLFELVSVCKTCHWEITKMDKGEYLEGATRLYQNLLS